ncbi:MAG: methylmalonyl-CoA epimerase [Oligoflexia bacterium]|jgi:methylmalonyl-CoA/ethylmalonyl-CoA epimerase
MKIWLNHIGVAVQEPSGLTRTLELLGFNKTHIEPVPEQGVKTHFIPLSQATTQVELLEVTDPEGTVAKFLEKKGPGVHHLSFEVERGALDSLTAKLAAAGLQWIYPAPRPGAHGMRVNFIHPKSAGGVLIEVMEPDHGT